VAGASCTWTIYAIDTNTGQSTYYIVGGTDSYKAAWGGGVEVKTLSEPHPISWTPYSL
jgi:hypothetical protein